MSTRNTTRRRGSRPRRQRVRTNWVNSSLGSGTVADGGSAVIDVLGGLTLIEKQQVGTILRTLWTVSVRSSTAGNLAFGRFGLIRVTDDAMAASSVPTPLSDHLSSWMLNNTYRQEDAANVPREYSGDLRSQRRLEGFEQTIAFAIESDPASVGNAIYSFGFRFLFSIK